MGDLAKPGAWRALGLALCTLWGNMLLLGVPASPLLAQPFASRVTSMAFSILGFALVYLLARSGGWRPVRERPALLGAMSALASAGSLVHFGCGVWAGIPGWADVAAVAVFSVAFAFPLVACGEVYADLGGRRAVVYAGVSYFLAWVGCSLVGGLSAGWVCSVATALPIATSALVVAPESLGARGAQPAGGTDADAGEAARRAPEADPGETGPLVSLAQDVRRSLRAIPPGILSALGITYFAIGSTWAQAGSPQDYFEMGMVAVAALTSLAVIGVALALHGRLSLMGVYKALLIGQVLAAFLLSEWAAAAQVALVITLVGVKIVAWTLMAELAHRSGAGGVAATAVYALGCLAGHVGEGVAGVIGVFQIVPQSIMLIVVIVLLFVAAAFLFTPGGKVDIDAASALPSDDACEPQQAIDAASSSLAQAASPTGAPAAPTVATGAEAFDARIAELARSYLLSERETDVFRLWATGHTLKYIQDKLALSPSTVKTHVRHIYDKTGLHSRAEVVALLDEGREG